MEDIFGAAAAARPPKERVGADPIEAIVVPRPKRVRQRAVGAPTLLAFGALIGGAAAWLALPQPVPQHRSAPTRLARAAERSPELPVSPVLSARIEQARAAPLPVPVSIVPAFASPDDGDASAAQARAALPKQAKVIPAAYRPARNKAQRRPRRIAYSADAEAPCARMRGLWRARCMRPHILAADRRLRDAYDDAARAGVDRGMLVAYRNRWNRIRGEAVSDPTYVAVTFQQMAQRLDAARADADRAQF